MCACVFRCACVYTCVQVPKVVGKAVESFELDLRWFLIVGCRYWVPEYCKNNSYRLCPIFKSRWGDFFSSSHWKVLFKVVYWIFAAKAKSPEAFHRKTLITLWFIEDFFWFVLVPHRLFVLSLSPSRRGSHWMAFLFQFTFISPALTFDREASSLGDIILRFFFLHSFSQKSLFNLILTSRHFYLQHISTLHLSCTLHTHSAFISSLCQD